ncbi:MAG: universal stress protein [Syntrophobacteraceae bacterium]|nr:universal stress protein [Syntrophobacteraceae bacterium]
MRIMACYDDSEETPEVLRVALDHAKAFDGEVLLVTSVVSADKFYPDLLVPHEQALKKAEQYFSGNAIACETKIAFRGLEENAGEALVMLAAKEKVDEIVIGIKRRSKLSKLIMGSVAQFVILQADCPVVGVKKKS